MKNSIPPTRSYNVVSSVLLTLSAYEAILVSGNFVGETGLRIRGHIALKQLGEGGFDPIREDIRQSVADFDWEVRWPLLQETHHAFFGVSAGPT